MTKRQSAARAIATAQLLSGQLDGLMAAWERTITAAQSPTSRVGGRGAQTESASTLRDLQRELAVLEREVIALRAKADAEVGRAIDWEAREMLAAREGRDELAKRAAHHAEQHRIAAEALATEAAATGETVTSYRRAVAVLRPIPRPVTSAPAREAPPPG